MKKYVISLKHREDRRNNFIEKNKVIGDFMWFNAHEGQKITHDGLRSIGFATNKKWIDPLLNRPLTKGEVGCFLSHYTLWKMCIENDQPVMILEDDAVYNGSGFNEQYFELLLETSDFIYLSRNEMTPDGVEYINEVIERPCYPYWLTAYIITPAAAKILVNEEIEKSIIPIDEYVPTKLSQLKNPIAFKQNMFDQAGWSNLSSNVESSDEKDFFKDFNYHVLTVGTDENKCSMLYESCNKNDTDIVNLGKDKQWSGGTMESTGGGHKLILLKQFIDTLPDEDVVLFVDGYDVFLSRSAEDIVGRYLSFQTQALFAAEKYCWPDQSLADSFPDNGTPYKYLNSGTFISTVGLLKDILAEEIEPDDDDQLYIQNKFLSGQYDIKLDYEQYVFQTHEQKVYVNGTQLINPVTNVSPCLYHGNGDQQAKIHFRELYNQLFPRKFFISSPSHNFEKLSEDMLLIDFMTKDMCDDMIEISEQHGIWKSMYNDDYPGQELRLRHIGLLDALEQHWMTNVKPIIESYWKPTREYGIRDAFIIKYSPETQRSLDLHNDVSQVTGSVKLNDQYSGAELVFPRQKITNKDIPVGKCILFPGQLTHAHECVPIISGTKYSLTIWSRRYSDDINNG